MESHEAGGEERFGGVIGAGTRPRLQTSFPTRECLALHLKARASQFRGSPDTLPADDSPACEAAHLARQSRTSVVLAERRDGYASQGQQGPHPNADCWTTTINPGLRPPSCRGGLALAAFDGCSPSRAASTRPNQSASSGRLDKPPAPLRARPTPPQGWSPSGIGTWLAQCMMEPLRCAKSVKNIAEPHSKSQVLPVRCGPTRPTTHEVTFTGPLH